MARLLQSIKWKKYGMYSTTRVLKSGSEPYFRRSLELILW